MTRHDNNLNIKQNDKLVVTTNCITRKFHPYHILFQVLYIIPSVMGDTPRNADIITWRQVILYNHFWNKSCQDKPTISLNYQARHISWSTSLSIASTFSNKAHNGWHVSKTSKHPLKVDTLATCISNRARHGEITSTVFKWWSYKIEVITDHWLLITDYCMSCKRGTSSPSVLPCFAARSIAVAFFVASLFSSE